MAPVAGSLGMSAHEGVELRVVEARCRSPLVLIVAMAAVGCKPALMHVLMAAPTLLTQPEKGAAARELIEPWQPDRGARILTMACRAFQRIMASMQFKLHIRVAEVV